MMNNNESNESTDNIKNTDINEVTMTEEEIKINAPETVAMEVEEIVANDNEKFTAQEMTEAIYNVHERVNEALIGNVPETEMEVDREDVDETKDIKDTNEGFDEGNEEIIKTEPVVTLVESVPSNNTQAPTNNYYSPSPQLVKEQIKYCQRILKVLKRHREAGPFLLPVDPVALNIPDYFTVIKQPMDLSTVSKKLDLNEYSSAEAFMSDVRLILTNCFTYNAPDSQVTKMGRSLEKYFNTTMAKMPMEVGATTASLGTSISAVESPGARPKRESVSVSNISSSTASLQRRPSSPSASLTFCSSVLRELMKKTNAHLNWPFMLPVDPIALNIPDYFTVIKQPMDLSTIRKKLDTGMYTRSDQFENDVRLVFSNCYAYNPPESDVYKMARNLEAIFEQKLIQKPAPKATHAASSAASTSNASSISSISHQASQSASTAYMATPSSASQLISGLDSLEDDSEKILAINHQIQILQAELSYLLLKRKSSSSSSMMASSQRSLTDSTGGVVKKPKKKPAAPSNLMNSVPAGGKSANAPPSVQTLAEMSFDEKRQLSEDVSNLAQDNMMRVLEIIQECMPNLHSSGDSDVIELDIEALDLRTLRTLQSYIWECKNPGKKRKVPASSAKTPSTTAALVKKAKEEIIPVETANQNLNVSAHYDSSSSSSSTEDED